MFKSIYCPYCRNYRSIERLILRTGTSIGGRDVTTSASWYDSEGENNWSMCKCNSCSNAVLVKNDFEQVYPTPLPSPTDQQIIEGVRLDLEEAKLCYSIKANNAAVVLARRAIQSLCIDKGADRKLKLFQQIDQLKELGIITIELKDWANEVRYIGNEGAHPGEVVSKNDANDVLELTEQMCQVIYVMPGMAKELKEKRIKKKASNKRG